MCVCLCLCVRVPRVLVKYSKIDVTPRAFSRSQAGRETDLFLVLLSPPMSLLFSFSLHFASPDFLVHPSPSLSSSLGPHIISSLFSIFLPRSVSRCLCACLSLSTFPQFSLSLLFCITYIYFIYRAFKRLSLPPRFEVTKTIRLLLQRRSAILFLFVSLGFPGFWPLTQPGPFSLLIRWKARYRRTAANVLQRELCPHAFFS